MNLLMYWKNEDGEDEVITPPLDGTILPGITRRSILTLMREFGEFKVSEKPFKIQQVIKAIEENRLYEIFGCGTAALISPVSQFTYKDQVYEVPIDKDVGAGKLAQRMLKTLTDLQYMRTDRPAWQFRV